MDTTTATVSHPVSAPAGVATRTKTIYLRDEKRNPYGLIMYYRDEKGNTVYSYSLARTSMDSFTRKRGQEIAKSRLKNKPIYVPVALDPKSPRVLDAVKAHIKSKDMDFPSPLVQWVMTTDPLVQMAQELKAQSFISGVKIDGRFIDCTVNGNSVVLDLPKNSTLWGVSYDLGRRGFGTTSPDVWLEADRVVAFLKDRFVPVKATA